MIQANRGYLIIGKQTAKGTATTPTLSIPFQSEGFSTDHSVSILTEGQDNNYKKSNVKMMHTENFSYTLYPRPNQLAYMFGWFLGDDAVTGGADPYTHVMTKSDRAWLTLERKLDTSVVQRLYDAKIESLTLSGEAGQPISMSIAGQACNVTIIATERTESYEDRNPFMFYNGIGRFKFATTVDRLINSFNISFSVSGGGLTDDTFQVVDLLDLDYDIEMSAGFITEDTTRWKNINYYGTTIPSENVYTAAFELNCWYPQTSTRQVKVTIPLIKYQPLGLNLSGAVNTMREEVAGVAEKQATTELATITCMNNIATTII